LRFDRDPGVRTIRPASNPNQPGQNGGFRFSAWEEAVVFDLTKPIEPQISHARDALIRKQGVWARRYGLEEDQKPNFRPAEWMEYLRILDARGAGVSQKEIGEALFPDLDYGTARDRVRKREKRAKELRDWGYRFVPLLEPTFTDALTQENSFP
jgi:hypothetical protein